MNTIQVSDHLTTFSLNQESVSILKNDLDSYLDQLLPYLDSNHQKGEAHEKECKVLYEKLKKYNQILWLGTGGSSLGAQALVSFCKCDKQKIKFIDNIDPKTFEDSVRGINPQTTALIVVSKSGETLETLSQLYHLLPIFEPYKENIFFILGNKQSSLYEISNHFQAYVTEFPHEIVGRYSVFSISGLLAGLLSGVNTQSFLKGALSCLKEKDQIIAEMKSLYRIDKNQLVSWIYCDSLRVYGSWFNQLWAESLGKKSTRKCVTPMTSFGTNDQHSVFQLYLDGPQDKVFTLITYEDENSLSENKTTCETTKQSSCLFNSSFFEKYPKQKELALEPMNSLFLKNFKLVEKALSKRSIPYRTLILKGAREEVLGELMMRNIIETIVFSLLLQVNPFDQPAVDTEKKSLSFS